MLDLNRFLNNDCTEYAKKQKAFNYATDAEKHQANGEYIQALTSWNNVLSQNVARNLRAHVYNKRSLIYRETQLYKQCLNNIALAEYCGCTEDLSERKAFCERAIDKHGKNVGIPMPKKFLKLSYTVNPKLPFMVDCLKLETNSQHKYNIITERDLFVGDVIAIEDPFFTVSFAVKGMKASGSGQRCYHCNKDNFLNLMQCSTCDKGMFI